MLKTQVIPDNSVAKIKTIIVQYLKQKKNELIDL